LNKQMNKIESVETKEQVMRLTNPFIEMGIREGVEKGMLAGRREGQVELVLRQIKRRWGALPLPQKRAIRSLKLAKIETLGESLLDFESRADLFRWLKQNAS
jgi:hypothetical protein